MESVAGHAEERTRLGALLKRLRTQAGLSQVAASRQWGRSAPDLMALEAGGTGVSLLSLRALCAVYGTTLSQLVRDLDGEA